MRTYRNPAVSVMLVGVLLAACAGQPAIVATPTAPGEPSPSAAQPTPTLTQVPTLTAIEDLGRTGTPVSVDISSYRLLVDGLVNQPMSLSYDELLAYPAVAKAPRLECPGVFVNYAEWTGPLVRTLLEHAGVQAGAATVGFSDGSEFPYDKELTLEEAMRDDTFLAYKVNGETLPVEHGYPIRLVAGSKLGGYWVKWLFHIEVK